MIINIKALSVNAAYKGRRYKTDEHGAYCRKCALLLKPMNVPEGLLKLDIAFYVSSTFFDTDNGLKPFIDVLQKKYGFNDNRIYRIIADKYIVKKGHEKIVFTISALDR